MQLAVYHTLASMSRKTVSDSSPYCALESARFPARRFGILHKLSFVYAAGCVYNSAGKHQIRSLVLNDCKELKHSYDCTRSYDYCQYTFINNCSRRFDLPQTWQAWYNTFHKRSVVITSSIVCKDSTTPCYPVCLHPPGRMRTYFAVRAIYRRDVARHKPQLMMIQSSANIHTDKQSASAELRCGVYSICPQIGWGVQIGL